MKQVLICALVAGIVSVAVIWLEDVYETDDSDIAADAGTAAPAGPPAPSVVLGLRYTDALIEDTWVNAARQPGADKRTLTSTSDSICFLTRIEISGIQGPEDTSSCAIEVDEFTGFWQLIATADEGGRSEIRCNARCLTWETEEGEP